MRLETIKMIRSLPLLDILEPLVKLIESELEGRKLTK
jgi:hypothetical protein